MTARLAMAACLAAALLPAGCQKRVASITIRVSDVRFPDNHEDHAVKPGESFQIADTEYWAEVGEFVPDFVLSMETREVSSRSKEPNNPAVKLSLFRGDAKLYDSWVMKPGALKHMVREPGFIFEITDIAFE